MSFGNIILLVALTWAVSATVTVIYIQTKLKLKYDEYESLVMAFRANEKELSHIYALTSDCPRCRRLVVPSMWRTGGKP